jgi:membrane protein implicated in regulation of membrane protease activity
MKIALMLMFIFHALIHGLGFAKAFQWLPLPQLTLPISRLMGVFWLLTALALLLSGILMLAAFRSWWVLAGIALASSQLLIMQSWFAAKYGTIVNGILFIAVLVAFGSWKFERQWDRLRDDLGQEIPGQDSALVTEDSLRALPPPVQNWLRWSGIVGRPEIVSLTLKRKGSLRLKPEASPWLPCESDPPGPTHRARLYFIFARMGNPINLSPSVLRM